MVRQIPKRLLIHTVKYKEYKSGGAWGGGSGDYLPEKEYKRVRVEPTSQLITDSNGNNVTARALMFVDMINSDTGNSMPKEKSKVVFEGMEFVVQKVEYLYARTLHHLEVYLV